MKEILIKSLTSEGIDSTLSLLDKVLIDNGHSRDMLILLLGEYKELEKKIIIGVLDDATENLFIAKLRGRILKFINLLRNEQLATSKPSGINYKTISSIPIDLPADIAISIGMLDINSATKRLKFLRTFFLDLFYDFLDKLNAKNKIEKEVIESYKVGGITMENSCEVVTQLGAWENNLRDYSSSLQNIYEKTDAIHKEIIILGLYAAQNFENDITQGKSFELDIIDFCSEEFENGAINLMEALAENVNKFENSPLKLMKMTGVEVVDKTIINYNQVNDYMKKIIASLTTIRNNITNYKNALILMRTE